MEDLIKFITTEQSRRSEAFMFFWRILMAILLTNHQMNELGYYFVNKEISLNTALNFLFSPAFFYASFYYLIFVFLFFWGLKVLVVIELVILGLFNIVMSEESLLIAFKLFDVFQKHNECWYFKDRDGFEFLKKFCQELDNPNSAYKENTYSVLNIIISTYWWYSSISENIVFPMWIDTIFLFLSIIGIFQTLCFFAIMTAGGNLHKMLIEYKKKGFLNEIILQNKSNSNIAELP